MSVPGLPIKLPEFPRTALFGADGFIGRHLLGGLLLANSGSVAIGRRPLTGRLCFDFAAGDDVRSLGLKKRGITHAIIAAGVANIAICERNPAETHAVNVAGTVALIKQLLRDGIRVLAFSSDYVFDGVSGNYTAESSVNPLNEYGRQKVALERSLLGNSGKNLLVIRLSKVFDTCPGSGTLLDEMAGKLLRGMPVRAAFDQYFCPTLIDDVVAVAGSLLSTSITGVIHLCAPIKINRLELAYKIAETFKCDKSLITKKSLPELCEAFIRPLDTSMVCSNVITDMHYRFRSVDESLKELQELYKLGK